MKKLVIGLGSGRCGTVSLRDLLIHSGFDTTHELELMPWIPDYNLCDEIIAKVLSRKSYFVSDIGYYYLPYISHIIEMYPTVKCVCLQRCIIKVVDSFMKFSKYNYWSIPYINREETEWDKTFPTYQDISKSNGIKLYWSEYYDTVKVLTEKYPDNIRVFDMNETLNTKIGQLKMFEFIGVSKRVKLGIKRHSNPPDREYKYF